MLGTRTLTLTTTVLLGLAASAPVFAHGGNAGSGSGSSGGGSSGTTSTTKTPPPCPTGYVPKNGACQHAQTGVLPDGDLYQMGRALALAGYWRQALPILEAVARRDDAMVYTMRGYATRKLGDVPAAMKLYDTALAIDPANVNTHEYVGEAYVTVGKVDLARAELATVLRLCGSTACEQYEDLENAIRTGETE